MWAIREVYHTSIISSNMWDVSNVLRPGMSKYNPDHSKRSFTRFLFATANTLLCKVRLYERAEQHSSRSPLSEKFWSLITVFDSLLERAIKECIKDCDSFLKYSFCSALCAKVSRRSDNCYVMITVVVSIHAAFYANCQLIPLHLKCSHVLSLCSPMLCQRLAVRQWQNFYKTLKTVHRFGSPTL